MRHKLKTDPQPFNDVASGKKTFEIRYDDRNFQVGDLLELNKTRFTGEEMKSGVGLEYTGDSVVVRVMHLMEGPVYGLKNGWVIMSVSIC